MEQEEKDKLRYEQKSLVAQRLAICNDCPLFNADMVACGACGCNLNVKAKLQDATCPIGRW